MGSYMGGEGGYYRSPITSALDVSDVSTTQRTGRDFRQTFSCREIPVTRAKLCRYCRGEQQAGRGECWCATKRLSALISPGMCTQCNLIRLSPLPPAPSLTRSLAILSNTGPQPHSHSANSLSRGTAPAASAFRWVLVSLS